MNKDDTNAYEQAYTREKARRQEAERLLEVKTQELYDKNTELEASYEELRRQQAVLIQTEKMATIGTLSSGVAHEINNPLAYVLSNVESLRENVTALFAIQSTFESAIADFTGSQASVLSGHQAQELDFIRQDMPELMADIEEGLVRIREVVNNLRLFSRSQDNEQHETDLIEQVSNSLKLLHGKFKHLVTIHTDFQPLPPLYCKTNEINQVILNLLVNAQQATEGQPKPEINVRTYVADGHAVVEVKDNGEGMAEAVRQRVFEPFFTTKKEGEGTGMGLAISYGIINDHGGFIDVTSTEGRGSCFRIGLPLS